MISKYEINQMLKRAKQQNAKYMIVVCDNYDFSDFPVFVKSKKELEETLQEYAIKRDYKIMEVYDMSMDLNKQLNEEKAWHTD